MPNDIEVLVFESSEDFELAAVQLLHDTLTQFRTAPAAILLSGGNTPRPIYRRLQETPVLVDEQVYIGYTDERHVEPNAPESNYGMTRGMLEALKFPNERLLCVETEHALETAAYEYHNSLAAFLEQGGTIPLALLGIGIDGHICSLFSDADLRYPEGQFAIAVTRPDGLNRVSITPDVLRRAERIVILAAGQEKADVAEMLLTEPESLVAGRALAGCQNVQLWIV